MRAQMKGQQTKRVSRYIWIWQTIMKWKIKLFDPLTAIAVSNVVVSKQKNYAGK